MTEGVELLDRVVVSTDNEEIANEAEANGISAPFRRPVELAGDRVGDLEVLSHALEVIERIDNKIYDVIVMLQPTAPLRQPKHVEDAIRQLVDGGYDAVWSVSRSDPKMHPLKQLVVKDKRLTYYDPEGERIIARQQLSPLYYRNGIVYAFTRRCIAVENKLLPDNSAAHVIEEETVNIDTEKDLEQAAQKMEGLLMDGGDE